MRKKPIVIIGLGHVGLTLALTFAEEGFSVMGVDTSPEILKSLQNRESPFFEPGLTELLQKNLDKNFRFFEFIPDQEVSAYILCVGTPVTSQDKSPDMEAARKALQQIALKMKNESLVILRSTVPVGTSREIFLPILQTSQKKFYYAFCPERVCEGNALKELRTLPQIIGGLDTPSLEKASALFETITPTRVAVSSLEAAETVKLLDNCWRNTAFAFSNEVGLFCESLGLDACQIIEWANLGYKRNCIPKPGFVGGPCLSKDTYLLTQPAGRKKASLPFIETARHIHQQLPDYVCNRLKSFFDQNGKEIQKCKIFLSGLAFKGTPVTDDMRGSPGLDVLFSLRKNGARILFGHDFACSPESITKLDIPSVSMEEGFQNADAVLFLNNHENYSRLNLRLLLERMNKPAFFFDAWHLFATENRCAMPGITHGGIGF